MKSSEHSLFDPVGDTSQSNHILNSVDIGNLIKAKAPNYYRYIPRFVISLLRKIIHQDELNDFLRLYGHLQGADFAEAMIKHLNITVEVHGMENIPTETCRLIFASNHPLGALDGITIISILGRKYPNRFRFIVNDMLMFVPPLAPIFLPVNKHGAQSRNATSALIATMEADFAVATFPAGLCSRNTHADVIEDLEWKKAFIAHALHYNRAIVPMHFLAQNSKLFYRVAKLRKLLRIKFNIEMILLPREIFKSRDKKFIITFGSPINPEELTPAHSHKEWAAKIRERVYQLNNINLK
ncbi:MAG: 1-acyl-sn-glycerol-3-phosphate acyltransferase [Muribaculaceae bacterium]|nr:1-acyl-sn-glycerol-3-phosphate acyltransferase [Muribaculaceae bacterium]